LTGGVGFYDKGNGGKAYFVGGKAGGAVAAMNGDNAFSGLAGGAQGGAALAQARAGVAYSQVGKELFFVRVSTQRFQSGFAAGVDGGAGSAFATGPGYDVSRDVVQAGGRNVFEVNEIQGDYWNVSFATKATTSLHAPG